MGEVNTTTASAERDRPVAGVLAEFAGPEELVAAAREVRDAGYTRWDCFSPFPVHGIDSAMGTRPTRLPWVVFLAGVIGGFLALLLQWWTNAFNYKLIISGKPLFSLPANIPITFELIVLFAALAAFGGTLFFTDLPKLFHPLFGNRRFRRVTSDGFFLFIEAEDPQFDVAAAEELLAETDAEAIEVCREPETQTAFPKALTWTLVVLGSLAVLPPLLIMLARYKKSEVPRIHLIQDMDFQPKYKAQSASPLFADGRAMRPPVPHTIARDELRADTHFYEGKVPGEAGSDGQAQYAFATAFPGQFEISDQTMRRGRQRYDIYCATCHGLAGDGDGMTSRRAQARQETAWVPPAVLHGDKVRKMPVGQIFDTITRGVVTNNIRSMAAYGPQIPVEDRWAIVLYIRALQKAIPPAPAPKPKEESAKAKPKPGEKTQESKPSPDEKPDSKKVPEKTD